jgi:hypothetical protein
MLPHLLLDVLRVAAPSLLHDARKVRSPWAVPTVLVGTQFSSASFSTAQKTLHLGWSKPAELAVRATTPLVEHALKHQYLAVIRLRRLMFDGAQVARAQLGKRHSAKAQVRIPRPHRSFFATWPSLVFKLRRISLPPDLYASIVGRSRAVAASPTLSKRFQSFEISGKLRLYCG